MFFGGGIFVANSMMMDAVNHWKEVYSDPANLVEIVLTNPTDVVRKVWIEPAAFMVTLDARMEYKVVTHDRLFRMEFDSGDRVTLWLDRSVGFVLYKLVMVEGVYEWVVEVDCSGDQGLV
jgi:hypothetical protein